MSDLSASDDSQADKQAESIQSAISYDQLLHLLKEDDNVKHLLQQLMKNWFSHLIDAPAQAVNPEINDISAPATPVVVDTLRDELADQWALWQLVSADAELAGLWLGDQNANQGQQLVCLIAHAAQWDQVLALWDRLAERCKQRNTAATTDEQQILAAALAIHNRLWQGRQAALITANIGEAYDYKQHQRGGRPVGEQIQAVWLAGLLNVGGELLKPVLVET
jgi:hypothetical protein